MYIGLDEQAELGCQVQYKLRLSLNTQVGTNFLLTLLSAKAGHSGFMGYGDLFSPGSFIKIHV